MNNDGDNSQSFHQGFNAAAVFGLCALGYYEVISGGVFVMLMLLLIGIYSCRFR